MNNSIPIPSNFTLDYYIQQKEQLKTDAELADEFYVSYATLDKWKKRLGWKAGMGRKYTGRRKYPLTEQIIKLHHNGLNNVEIAKTLGITDRTVYDHLYKFGNLPIPEKEIKVTKEIIRQAAENGIGAYTLKHRIYGYKWPVERAISEPVDTKKRKKSVV